MRRRRSPQAPDYGDLSYLLRPAYTAALRDQLAEAPTWEFSFRKDAPQPEVRERRGAVR